MKVLIILILTIWGQYAYSMPDGSEDHLKVLIRKIGDDFLLHQGDKTTRVLPVEVDAGKYRLRFSSELDLDIDILTTIVADIAMECGDIDGIRVETVTCTSRELVHSFEIIALANSMTPCRSRPLPKDCYEINFTTIVTKSPTPVKENQKSTRLPVMLLFLFLLGLAISYIVRKRSNKNDNVREANTICIGSYDFDPTDMTLSYGDHIEELSGKEAGLLQLLLDNINETVPRELIQQEVWSDNDDYMGRTIDVHISKLRKRLETDPRVKIINIRGIGYRMVANTI